MKYVAVFDVPDDYTLSRFINGASAIFSKPDGDFVVEKTELKKLPDRIPPEWNTAEAAGFNACLDRIEEKG